MSVTTITVGETTCNDMLVPIQDALYVVNGKWKILILVAISHGYQRFTDIQKNVPKISGKVLAKELKELEQNELIKRTVLDDYPVSITYTVTEYAKTLEKVIYELHEWGVNHRKRILKK